MEEGRECDGEQAKIQYTVNERKWFNYKPQHVHLSVCPTVYSPSTLLSIHPSIHLPTIHPYIHLHISLPPPHLGGTGLPLLLLHPLLQLQQSRLHPPSHLTPHTLSSSTLHPCTIRQGTRPPGCLPDTCYLLNILLHSL